MSIWDTKQVRKSVDEHIELLTLDEGGTQVENVKINGTNILLKREDQNPTGSWKDRGSAYKMTLMSNRETKEAVISSSGNAAISYLTYAQLMPNLKLHVVVSPKINPLKLEKIKQLLDNRHQLHVVDQTRKTSIKIAAERGIPNLRASIDEEIVKGYWSLGFELAEILKSKGDNTNSALFCPVSSGTALVGLAQGLLMKLQDIYLMPQIYVCQTQSVAPMVNDLSTTETSSEASLADAIIDTIALRLHQVEKVINETNGGGFAITNNELVNAQEQISTHKLSYTSLLSVAGFLRVREHKKLKNVICITSGL